MWIKVRELSVITGLSVKMLEGFMEDGRLPYWQPPKRNAHRLIAVGEVENFLAKIDFPRSQTIRVLKRIEALGQEAPEGPEGPERHEGPERLERL